MTPESGTAISPQRLADIDDICYVRDCKVEDHRAIHDLCAEVDRLNSQLAKYVGWEPTVREEYDHACAVAERAEAVVKRFEAGPQLAVNAFVADLKHALEMP